MSSLIHAVVLFLFIVCLFNDSVDADSVKGYETPAPPSLPFNESKINLLFVSIKNNMPIASPMSLNYNGEGWTEIGVGDVFTKLDNLSPKQCQIKTSHRCLDFAAYDPKFEGTNQKIYWSVTKFGLFHSFDEGRSWNKFKDFKFPCY